MFSKPNSLPCASISALLLLAALQSPGLAEREEVLPTVEEILEKARIVNAMYPWILLNDRGLTLTAYDLPREEFLRGLSEATDLVFSGTEELPESISLIIHSARADEVFQEILRLDPFLAYEGRWSEKQVIFSKVANPTVGLSDQELIARYRRPRPSLNSIRSDRGGAFVTGALIAEGTRFPVPLDLEIVPDRSAGKVYLLCNRAILREFPFKNPGELDLALFQASSPEDRRKAVKEKLDQIHHEVSRLPMSSSVELLAGIARAAAYLPQVAGTAVVGSSLHVRMGDGSEFEWVAPSEEERMYWSEQEAIQAVFAYQNKLNFDLSRGGVALVSEQFGDTAIENGFEFFRRLDEIAADGNRSLAEKELEIRKEWRNHADWVLEYFYTSIVSPSSLETQVQPAPFQTVLDATRGLGIPPNIAEFLETPPPPPLLSAPAAGAPLQRYPSPPRVSVPEPELPSELPAPPPLEGVGLESLIDPEAEAAQDLFPTP